jgi:peptidyl-prolyl cis-trans isomerase D
MSGQGAPARLAAFLSEWTAAMISFFRNIMSSWVALLILGLLIVAVVVTGIGSSPMGGATSSTLARVAGTSITDAELNAEMQRRLEFIRRENPDVSMAQLVEQGGAKATLDLMVQREAFKKTLGDLGITSSQAALDNAVAAIPAFQIGGQFSKKAYLEALQRNRIDPKEFEDSLRLDIVQTQFLSAVGRGWQVPDKALLTYAKLLAERRSATLAFVPAQLMTGVQLPDDKTLAAYYEKSKDRFSIPEHRSFRYFVINPALAGAKIQITDADLKAEFDKRASEFGSVETRVVQQVLFDSQAAAQAFATKAASGDFVATAQAAVPGLTAEDINAGTIDAKAATESYGEAASKAVFALKAGAVSAPIQSELGWYVFRVAEVIVAKTGSFEAARAQLTQALRDEKAIDEVFRLTEEIEKSARDGGNFDALLKIAGAQAQTAANATQAGQDAKSGQPVQLPAGVLGVAFSHQPGDELTVEQMGQDPNAFVVVEVTDVKDKAPRPLAEIKQPLTAAWIQEQMLARAKATADGLVAAIAKGTPLAQAAAALKLPVQPVPPVARGEAMQGGEVPQAIRDMFRLRAGQAAASALPQGAGFAVVQVGQVIPADIAIDNPAIAQLRSGLAQGAGNEAKEQMLLAAAAKQEVRYNNAALERVRQQLLGSGE